ncbi:MAG: DUF5615 family PIN-like protein [Phycisphaerales bacterium]|nr:DUF5615 family PIN-like protein [Phycisphaerales bacterium]
MRLLANENMPSSVVRALRERGHDVLWAKESMAGQPGAVLLSRARQDGRLLITFDKDFGELTFREGRDASCGVILFRIPTPTPQSAADAVASAIDSRADWSGYFAVVKPGMVRLSALPSRTGRD